MRFPPQGTITRAELNIVEAELAGHETELDAHTKNIYAVLRTGQYFTSFPVQGAATYRTLETGRLYAWPFPVARDITIDRLAVMVRVVDAGKKVRLGIYNDGTNIYPGSLLLDAGEVDVGTLGVKEIIVDQALPKGLYWFSVISDGAPALRKLQRPWSPIGLDPTDFGKVYINWYKTSTYGALLDPFPSGGAKTKTTNLCYHLAFARLASLD